jgi:hypothetical protein
VEICASCKEVYPTIKGGEEKTIDMPNSFLISSPSLDKVNKNTGISQGEKIDPGKDIFTT